MDIAGDVAFLLPLQMLRTLSFLTNRLRCYLHAACRDFENGSDLLAATKYNFSGLPDSASEFAHTMRSGSKVDGLLSFMSTAVAYVNRAVSTPTVACRRHELCKSLLTFPRQLSTRTLSISRDNRTSLTSTQIPRRPVHHQLPS